MDSISVLLKKIYLKLPVIAYDVSAIPVAWFFAYLFRYNMSSVHGQMMNLPCYSALSILIVSQVSCYYYFKVYRGLWRFSSLNDVSRIIRAVACSTLAVIPVFYAMSWLQSIPRSVLPLYSLILVTLLCGGRLLFRDHWDKRHKTQLLSTAKRVLIIGAGQAAESLVRDLKRSPSSYIPIGLVDDSPNKRGFEVHGVRVLGTIPKLPDLVATHRVDLIFIAIPSISSLDMRRIVAYCESSAVPFRTLPGLHAIASGRVEMNALRTVNIEDLLGRDQVTIQWDKIADSVQNKRILVTGGGGSIGSELCRQIMALKPSKLLILDSSEFNLYSIDHELKTLFPEQSIEMALVSVVDAIAVDHAFKEFQPEIVFHAAAYKHVPMLEHQIRVAVQNNVLGTEIVAQASVDVGVLKFVLISTDKAVNPTNIMGTTKRVAEIYCQNLNSRVSTQFITVRFGNVLGSMGSVVPLFQKQLESGGPLTVTHPDVQRYFMTIPEASQLILQAMVNGHGGEIFVLDMGEPIKVSYLAEQMIRLAGKEPGRDIQIVYTGLRAGEKLFEELFHASEQLADTDHAKLFQAKYRQIDWMELTQTMRMISEACRLQQHDELLILLKSLVPEFSCEKISEIS